MEYRHYSWLLQDHLAASCSLRNKDEAGCLLPAQLPGLVQQVEAGKLSLTWCLVKLADAGATGLLNSSDYHFVFSFTTKHILVQFLHTFHSAELSGACVQVTVDSLPLSLLVIISDTVDLVLRVHGERNPIQTFITDDAAETARVIGLP